MYEVQTLSIKQLLGILCYISSVLLFFYFMIKYFSVIWIITILFMLSMSSLLVPFFMELFTNLAKGNCKSILNLSIAGNFLSIKFMISLTIVLSLMLSWYFTKNWIANNLIGCLGVMVMLKMLRLNKITPGLLLLSMLFFYDIFWVFLSPYFFKGESVMVAVATNLDLPAKLVFPGWNVFTRCSLIGLGDLAIPGFFISFVTRFGDHMGTSAYYFFNLIAYFLSI